MRGEYWNIPLGLGLLLMLFSMAGMWHFEAACAEYIGPECVPDGAVIGLMGGLIVGLSGAVLGAVGLRRLERKGTNEGEVDTETETGIRLPSRPELAIWGLVLVLASIPLRRMAELSSEAPNHGMVAGQIVLSNIWWAVVVAGFVLLAVTLLPQEKPDIVEERR